MKPQFLKGVRLADLTWAGAGPFCTKNFSDFGADVLKIESTTRLDSVRTGGPFKDRKYGVNRSGYFASRNTGKKSVTLDLKSDLGRKLVYDIIRQSDVVTNNFGPGAMDRMGLSYETVSAIKQDVIYLSMPMYGESGPRAEMLGVGMTISAVTGLMWSTGYKSGDPVGPGTHYPDHAANPYHAAFAIMAALRWRRLTGEGMKIDLSQVESTISFIGTGVTDFAATGTEAADIGNGSRHAAPQGIYPSLGDNQWCAISVMNNQQWQRFAELAGRQDLATDPDYSTAAKRLERQDELNALAAAWTSARTVEAAVEALRVEGIPAARVANSRHLIEADAQLADRNYWQRVDHPELGRSLYSSPPYVVDGERVELSRPPLLGEHTHEVLRQLLGKDQAEIEKLEQAGVLK